MCLVCIYIKVHFRILPKWSIYCDKDEIESYPQFKTNRKRHFMKWCMPRERDGYTLLCDMVHMVRITSQLQDKLWLRNRKSYDTSSHKETWWRERTYLIHLQKYCSFSQILLWKWVYLGKQRLLSSPNDKHFNGAPSPEIRLWRL